MTKYLCNVFECREMISTGLYCDVHTNKRTEPAAFSVSAEQAHDGCRNTCCHREAKSQERERILKLLQDARSDFFYASAAWALDRLAERIAGLPSQSDPRPPATFGGPHDDTF